MENKYKTDSPRQRYHRDQLLISRVEKYLTENEAKPCINVAEMADELQKKYREYNRRKRNSFRILVRNAYHEIADDIIPIYDKDNEKDADITLEPENPVQNDMLLKLYMKSPGKENGNCNNKEIIDITMDENVNKTELLEDIKVNDKKTVSQNQQAPFNNESQAVSTEPIQRKKKRKREVNNENVTAEKRARIVSVDNLQITFTEALLCIKNKFLKQRILKAIQQLLVHIKHPVFFERVPFLPPRGFLFHGPSGCGKTLLAHAVAKELDIPLLEITATELVAGISGESETRIRNVFDQAIATAPCVLLLDKIDAISSDRSTAQREMEKRIVTQLLSCFDDLNVKENGDKVIVIGATNKPDSLDSALRTTGRFDLELPFGIPDKEAREKILAVHMEKLKTVLSPDVNPSTIASLTPGFVGSDLQALVRDAWLAAISRILKEFHSSDSNNYSSKINETKDENNRETQSLENNKNLTASNVPSEISAPTSNEIFSDDNSKIKNNSLTLGVLEELSRNSPDFIEEELTMFAWLRDQSPFSQDQIAHLCVQHKDFEDALQEAQPSQKREGFATVPDVTWDDVGSLKDIREELQMSILAPARYLQQFSMLGFTTASGILLYGPPGCGKTLLAKAIANEAGINFISVKGAELLNKYVGESEKAVKQCFTRAKNCAPCVIFFDEVDALCPRRGESDNHSISRVVNQVLTELNGIDEREGVFVMAATNRPEIIDPAMLRPGRLDKSIYVGLPSAADRVDILRALTKNGTKPKLAADVNLEEIGHNEKCNGFTGADLSALVRESGREVLKEIMAGQTSHADIYMRHFLTALEKIQPSVRDEDMKRYKKFGRLLGF